MRVEANAFMSQSEIISSTLRKIMGELQAIYQSFRVDVAKHEERMRFEPLAVRHWQFVAESLERLQSIAMRVSMCQQESLALTNRASYVVPAPIDRGLQMYRSQMY